MRACAASKISHGEDVLTAAPGAVQRRLDAYLTFSDNGLCGRRLTTFAQSGCSVA